MKARLGLATAMVVVLTVGVSGCSAQQRTCDVGYSASFNLTVVDQPPTELSVRFCDNEQCSPVPQAGPVPAYLTDRSNLHASLVRHLSHGEWTISPGGLKDSAPRTARISLCRNGVLKNTTSIHMRWPQVDPCAATFPAPLHITVQAS